MKTKFPILWIVAVLIIISGLIWYIFQIQTDAKIIDAKKEAKAIKIEIDSLSKNRKDVIKTISETSSENAKKAKNLIKKLPNEKITIPNAEFDSMYYYIQHFRTE